MPNDVRLAFAHPSERAEATAGSDPLDRISLRDHTVEVEIGAFQAERGTRQRIQFNVVVEVRPLPGPIDDNVDKILSYDRVTEAIATELSAERLNLLETLAERVADRILLEPQAMRVFVRIEKLDRGPGALGVEIARSKTEIGLTEVEATDIETVEPVVVCLSNAAIKSVNLTNWLDEIEATQTPVVICVGPSGMSQIQTSSPMAQRRIDLLDIEQNAWVLATRDRRCVVVDTLTELDWALKNGQISVWAPSKIVLDAVDGPEGDPSDSKVLFPWFAALMQAKSIIEVGDVGLKSSAKRDIDVKGLL